MKKIKAINNKIERNKALYNLDRQTAQISTLSSGNVSKSEWLTSKDVLPEEDLLEKAVVLGKELKKQTSIAGKQYQSKVFIDDGKEVPVKIEKEEPLTPAESSLISNSKYSFIEFKNAEKYEDESLVSRYNNYFTPFKQ